MFFAGEGAILCRQGFVFEGFQFRGDIALGIFQCLTAAVIIGHLCYLTMRDLDIEAMHLVVLHPQIGNARTFTFARLQINQKLPGVFRQAAQLIQLGVIAVSDHAAVTNHRRWLWRNRAFKQR